MVKHKQLPLFDNKETVSLSEALRIVGTGRYHNLLCVLCGSTFMADAIEVSLVGFLIAEVALEWDSTDAQIGTIAGAVFGGQLFGSLLIWGPFSELYGRRITYLVGTAMTGIFGVLSAFSLSLGWLLFFRFLVGIGVSSAIVCFDLLAEFVSPEQRGNYLMNTFYWYTLGSLLTPAMAWLLLDRFGWRIFLIVCGIPSLINLCVGYWKVHESPWWLAEKNRWNDVNKVIESVAMQNNIHLQSLRIAGNVKVYQSESECEDNDVDENKSISTSALSTYVIFKEIFAGTHALKSYIVFTIYALCGFGYFGLILLLSRYNTIARDGGTKVSFNYFDLLVNAAAEFVGLFIAANIVDRIGRRNTQMGFFFVAAVSVLILSLLNQQQQQAQQYPLVVTMLLAGIARMSTLAGYNTMWVMSAELFPTRLRTCVHSICNAVAKLSALLSPYLVLNQSISLTAAGVVLCIMNLMMLILTFALPETKDLNMEQMDSEELIEFHNILHVEPHTPISTSETFVQHHHVHKK